MTFPSQTRLEVSIDEPLNVDWDGNELLLSDILGTDEDVIYRDIETEMERKLLDKAIEKLSEREREWLRRAADEAAVYQRRLWAEQERESLEEMRTRGVEIIYPDKRPFEEAAAPMIERYKADPVFHDLIEQIQHTR